ncbi:MAG: response regulator [Bacteroidales bacterium]|nr:response regulator [Bacteroidales bacterium]
MPNISICEITGLPITKSEEFTNIHFKEDFYSNFIKIGENIIYMYGSGNISHYEDDVFQTKVNEFVEKMLVKKPMIIIRNTTGHTGKVPIREVKKYRNYVNENHNDIEAVIFISNQKWLKIILATGIKFFSPKVPYLVFDSYEKAIRKAVERTSFQTNIFQTALSFQQIDFNPDWHFQNLETNFSYKIGIVPNVLLFVAIKGNPGNVEDVKQSCEILEKVFAIAGFQSNPYYNITDYSELQEGGSLGLKKLYAREIKRINKTFNTEPKLSIICNASKFFKATVKLYSAFVRQKFVFVDSVAEAFRLINVNISTKESYETASIIKIKQDDVDQIIDLCGSIIWEEEQQNFQDALVNKDNPLITIADSLNIVRTEISSMVGNYQTILNDINCGILVSNAGSREILFINDLALKILDLSKDDIKKTTCNELLCGKSGGDCINTICSNFRNKEFIISDKKGNEHFLTISMTENIFENKTCYIHSFTEISDFKKVQHENEKHLLNLEKSKKVLISMMEDAEIANKKVKESDEYHRTLLRSIPDSIFVISSDGYFIDYKADVNDLFSSPEQFIGKNFKEILPPSVSELFDNHIRKSMENNLLEQIEYDLDIGGVIQHFQARIVPLGSDKLVTFVRNITEQKKASEEIISHNNMQTILIKLASQYINLPIEKIEQSISSSLEEIGGYVNADRAYIFEYDWEKNVCNNTHEWCQVGIEPQILELQNVPLEMLPWWVEAHKKGETLSIPDVFALNNDDGVRQILEPQKIKSLMTLPMMNNGVCTGFLGFDSVRAHHYYTKKEELLLAVFSEMLVNFNNRTTLEKRLIDEKKKADSANKAKSEFLANMSHEIRTPMNAILGFSEALYHKLENDNHKKMIKSVLSGGNLLLSLLNDILDLSKIEADKIEISPQPVDTINVINEIKLLFFEKTQKKGVALSVDATDSFPEGLLLDEIRFKQIIFNLVGNATKFTHKGFVRIKLDFVHSSDAGGELRIDISDTGIGIPDDQQKIIFEAFRQQSGQSNRQYGGAGLGLAISKRLAEKMKGNITVKSEIGKGSVFSLVIPDVKVCEKIIEKNDKYLPIDDIVFEENTILVVDDVISNIEAVESLLQGMGLRIVSADNGEMALEILKHTNPALILLDIRMPGLNGYQVAEIIKTNDSKKHIPVVALTASVSAKTNKDQLRNFNGFLYKPVSKGELVNELMKFLAYQKLKKQENNISSFETTLNILPNNTKEKLPEIGKILKNDYLPIWNEIKDGLVLFKIEDFANQLIDFGNSNKIDFLIQYSEQIIDYVNNVNIEDLLIHLNKFPEIIETILNFKN